MKRREIRKRIAGVLSAAASKINVDRQKRGAYISA